MANDGDKKDQGTPEAGVGAPGDGDKAAAIAAADAAVAAAEAAAAEATAAAEAAKAKAEALASQVAGEGDATQAAPAGEAAAAATPPVPPAAAPQAPPKQASEASVGEAGADYDAIVEVNPNSEGIFGTEVIDEVAGENYIVDKPYLKDGGRSKAALIVIAVVLVGLVGGLLYILNDDDARADMEAFFDGTIEEHKFREVRLKQAQWKAEDFRARHIYGDVTLTYFPQDSRVDIYQTKFVQDGAAWARREAGAGEKVCSAGAEGTQVCDKLLENATAKLGENQFIEALPLKNLPIFQTEKDASGSVERAFTYHYKVVISHEGYEPREFIWQKKDWIRAPGNYQMNWKGADLVPKPETYRDNFGQAHAELWCLMKIKEIPSLDKVPETNFELIRKRNGFKTMEDFDNAAKTLTVGEFAQWWTDKQKEIVAQECKPDEDGPKK